MYPLSFHLAILVQLLLLVSKISCIDLYNNPDFPCGVKFNSEPRAHQAPDPTPHSSLLIQARALNEKANGASVKEAQNPVQPNANQVKARQANVKKDRKYRKATLPPQDLRWKHKASSNQTASLNKLVGKDKKDLKVKTRIIGGTHASIKEFPWLVSVQLKHGSHICGGTILTDEYILTASHCVAEQGTNKLINREYKIGIGSSNWREGKTYDVVKVVKHDGFKFESFENDLAIMKVKPKIQMKKDVTVPICLPPEAHYNFVGTGTIAGWGKVDNDIPTTSSGLMMANIDILDSSLCKNAYSNYNDQKMICAGTVRGDRDSCNGDSGGPLQAVFPNGRVYLLGSVSFGDAVCGKANTPGVYTRQSVFIDWVNETIAKLSSA